MEYRRLGRSGLQLSVLSYGSWVTFHGQIEDKQAWTDAMKPVYDKFITDPKLKDMVAKVQATQ